MVTSVSAAALTLTVGSASAPPGGEVNIPIKVGGANNVGAVQFDLTYDGALLTPVNVKAGALAPNSLVEFNAETPGRLAIGLVTVAPINGDGELVTARFKVNGTQGQVIPLTMVNAQAWDETTLIDNLVKTEPGQITVTSSISMFYILLIAAVICGIGLLIIILIIIWLKMRRK